MAISNPATGHMVFAAGTDTVTFSPNIRVKRLVAATNGTDGAFDVLDAASGNRIAYHAGPGANGTAVLLEHSKVKGIYVEAIPTDGRVHLYYE